MSRQKVVSEGINLFYSTKSMKDKKLKRPNSHDNLFRLWKSRVETLRNTKQLLKGWRKDSPESKVLKELLTTLADTIEECATELSNPPEDLFNELGYYTPHPPGYTDKEDGDEDVLARAERKVVWISTAHISGRDLLLLNNRYPCCVGVFSDNPSIINIDSSRVPAHIIHVAAEDLIKDTMSSGFSDKFLSILETTRDLGYEYVVFDRDADVFPCWGFPHD